MSEIPMNHRGKRPRFFATPGMDEMVSMMLELTAEVWVIKKRLYLLEKAAGDAGMDLYSRIEAYQLDADEVGELADRRKQMIANVLRALEVEFGVPTDGVDQGGLSPGVPDAAASQVRAA